MSEKEYEPFDVESLSPEDLERYRRRYWAQLEREYEENRSNCLKEWYDEGVRLGQIKGCLHTIRLHIAKRFPTLSLSPKYDEELQSIDDYAQLISIEEYCYDAPSVAHIEGFIEAKFRDQNDAKENN